jgi:hypothetical protein
MTDQTYTEAEVEELMRQVQAELLAEWAYKLDAYAHREDVGAQLMAKYDGRQALEHKGAARAARNIARQMRTDIIRDHAERNGGNPPCLSS